MNTSQRTLNAAMEAVYSKAFHYSSLGIDADNSVSYAISDTLADIETYVKRETRQLENAIEYAFLRSKLYESP